jgi:hypothetical protein
MSRGWKYVSGEWQVYCDVCQRPLLASESRKRWDGLIVCKDDYEVRHPMDFIRVKPEKHGVPFSRPEPPDVFLDINYINLYVADLYIDPQSSSAITSDYILEE